MLEKCTRLWRKAHSEVKMSNKCWHRHTFSTSDVEKFYAAVAKSTFGSDNVKKMLTPEHFFNFRCRKILRGCGEKHIWKSKSTKHVGFQARFDVLMSKNCTPLWRKEHLEVKMLKMLTREHFFNFRCRKIVKPNLCVSLDCKCWKPQAC